MVLRAPSRRVPRTVLFTDIVGSTELASTLGDQRWRRLLARHNEVIRRELRRGHGREVDNAGDGFLAVFESPTDAVRTAAAILAGVHGLGLRIRAGIHAGEVETTGEKLGGIAVHIAARLLALAGTEEVLVSNTVRELVVGSGHEFEDRGEHELKGIPGRWRVHALVLPRLDESVAVDAADAPSERAGGRLGTRLAILAVAGVLIVAVAAVGLVAAALAPGPPATGGGSVVAFGDGDGPDAGWRAGRGPAAVDAADGILWTANVDSGTVTRIDARSGESITVGQVGPHPSAILAAHGSVWVADRYSGQVSVLAPSGALVRQVAIHASALAADDRTVWAADDLRDRLVRLDPRTFAELGTVELPSPSGAADMAFAAGTLWVAAPRGGGLVRVDVANASASTVPIDLGPITSVAGRGDDLWLASRSTDAVARVDARSGRVVARADVCDTPVALAPVEGGAWVACAVQPGSGLWRLDVAGKQARAIALDAVPAGVVLDGDRVWVALRDD